MDPYRKIMRAASAGKALRLTEDDVQALSMDDAIATAAVVKAVAICAKKGHRKGRTGVCECQRY